MWFDTPLASLPYNAVIRFCGEPSMVDRICDHYRRRGLPFVWVVHPSSPTWIGEALEEQGLQCAEEVPGMTMQLSDLPPRERTPADVEVREVNTLEALRPIQEMIAWRWEVPEADRDMHYRIACSFGIGTRNSPLRCWAAYFDGEPISKVLLNAENGVAGIHGVATKPEARGRGLARWLTLEALHVGRDAGCDLGMLHSSAMARSMYERLGFSEVARFAIYVSGAQLHF